MVWAVTTARDKQGRLLISHGPIGHRFVTCHPAKERNQIHLRSDKSTKLGLYLQPINFIASVTEAVHLDALMASMASDQNEGGHG